jgi:hypothetical protein
MHLPNAFLLHRIIYLEIPHEHLFVDGVDYTVQPQPARKSTSGLATFFSKGYHGAIAAYLKSWPIG